MKKIKLLTGWVYGGKKYNPDDIVEIPAKVYNHLKEIKFQFIDAPDEVKK